MIEVWTRSRKLLAVILAGCSNSQCPRLNHRQLTRAGSQKARRISMDAIMFVTLASSWIVGYSQKAGNPRSRLTEKQRVFHHGHDESLGAPSIREKISTTSTQSSRSHRRRSWLRWTPVVCFRWISMATKLRIILMLTRVDRVLLGNLV